MFYQLPLLPSTLQVFLSEAENLDKGFRLGFLWMWTEDSPVKEQGIQESKGNGTGIAGSDGRYGE